MKNDIFTEDLKNIPILDILEKIKKEGFFFFENAMNAVFLDRIEDDVKNYRFSSNENMPTGVYTFGQYYFVNLLQISKSFYNYLTSSFVGNICQGNFGHEFRLTALRYYETYGKYHMQWHTDNKTDKTFHEIPGLIFIFYLSDVNEGEFQYIKNSHNWSNLSAYNDFSDDFILNNYSEKIHSFKGKRGSLIIYNTYGVHRAKPSINSSFIRKSVFFQVDGDIQNSEPILLNTAFHTNRNEWVEQFLGFGLPQTYEVFPKSNVSSLPLKIKLNLVWLMIKGFLFQLVRLNKTLFNIVKNLRRIFRS